MICNLAEKALRFNIPDDPPFRAQNFQICKSTILKFATPCFLLGTGACVFIFLNIYKYHLNTSIIERPYHIITKMANFYEHA